MELYQFPFHAMGCPCELRFYARSRQNAEQIANSCIQEAKRFEQKYSRYRADSVTTCINQSAGKTPVTIDEETRAILHYAGVCYEQSEGLFDITSGVLRRVWNRERRFLPLETEIQECLGLIGWTKVEITADTAYLPIQGMELDFGGVVKEYAADTLSILARSHSIEHGLVNLGGDIAIIGPQVDDKPWSIGIVHPIEVETPIAVIRLWHGALATSGGYERYFDIGGKQFSHLINPKTGWPVDSLLSVSVAADKAVVAGSISSIALLRGTSDGLAWLKSSGSAYLAVDSELQCHGHLVTDGDKFSDGNGRYPRKG